MARSLPHYRDFRRYGAPQQATQQLIPKTTPAPTRGLILNENPAFMQPGAALVLDNFFPTEKSLVMRGGSLTWAQLTETTNVVSLFTYVTGTQRQMFAANLSNKLYNVTSATAVAIAGLTLTDGYFSTAQLSNLANNWLVAVNSKGDAPLRYNGTTWTQVDPTAITNWANSTAYAVGDTRKDPQLGTVWKVNAGQAHTSPAGPTTFAADRNTNPLRWSQATAADNITYITGPPGTAVANGKGLTQVWKYRRRLFFIQGGTMDAWYLDIDSVGGALQQIPLSGAFTKGGSLLFGCAWTVSAGDGLDDKCIFMTTEGEFAVFSGIDPSNINSWAQQGRFQVSKPMGKNAWLNIGGDVLIITKDGIVPISQALTKDIAALEFSALTRVIHPLWHEEILDKDDRPWSMAKWDEFGGLFVTLPGGFVGDWRSFVANTVTGAWCRFTGWDALVYCVHGDALFFGTQDGRIVQGNVEGKDHDSVRQTDPAAEVRRGYTSTYVAGWEVFGQPPFTYTLRQARTAFNTRSSHPFYPQVTASTNYLVELPPPPPAGPDIVPAEVWDEGTWGAGAEPTPVEPPLEANEPGAARWDQPGADTSPFRSTMWESIGETGISHAITVMISVKQQVKPDVELLGVSMLAEQAGLAV